MATEPASRRSRLSAPSVRPSGSGLAAHPREPISVAHFLMGRCNPESANGVDKTIYHLSRTQAALGHRVGVFSITNKPAIPIPGVEVRTYSPLLPFLGGRIGDVLLNRSPLNLPRRLVADLLAWDPTVVHFHFVHIGQAIRLARHVELAGIPYCVSLHGGLAVEAQRRRRVAKRAFAALFERRYLNRAAFLHAVSDLDVQGALAYGVDNRFALAPNCIDPGDVPQLLDPSILQVRFPSLRDRRIFLYLGRLDPQQKGLDLLVQGWAEFRHSGGDETAALVLVGPNWRGGKDRLERIARHFGVRESVLFVGTASGSEKWSLLSAADVFVHPSRWEAGVPFAVLEALVAGTPVILTRAADPDALVERDRAGILVEAEPNSISAGLREASMWDSAELRERGSAARRLVDREFRWELTADKLLTEYRAGAGRRHHSAGQVGS
jgi:glycosyltransferase involved in cell wall biosynthesis